MQNGQTSQVYLSSEGALVARYPGARVHKSRGCFGGRLLRAWHQSTEKNSTTEIYGGIQNEQTNDLKVGKQRMSPKHIFT